LEFLNSLLNSVSVFDFLNPLLQHFRNDVIGFIPGARPISCRLEIGCGNFVISGIPSQIQNGRAHWSRPISCRLEIGCGNEFWNEINFGNEADSKWPRNTTSIRNFEVRYFLEICS